MKSNFNFGVFGFGFLQLPLLWNSKAQPRLLSPTPSTRKRNTTGGPPDCYDELAALNAANIATLTHTPSPMGFLREICGRPEHEKPLMIVVAGHPSPDASVPDHALRKKPLSQIASWL